MMDPFQLKHPAERVLTSEWSVNSSAMVAYKKFLLWTEKFLTELKNNFVKDSDYKPILKSVVSALPGRRLR